MNTARFLSHGAVVCAGVIFALILIASISGCMGVEDLASVRAQAVELRSQVEAQATAAQATLTSLEARQLPPDDPALAAARAHAATLAAQRQSLDAAIAHADAVLTEANTPTDSLSRVLTELAPALPEPARSPVVLGGALLVALLRARQLKLGLASVAQGIDKAMRADPAFRASFQNHADTFRAIQTPVARRVVDESTRQGFMLRLPL